MVAMMTAVTFDYLGDIVPSRQVVFQQGGRERASKRLGLRYNKKFCSLKDKRHSGWIEAISSVEEMCRQRVEVDRPLAMIKSAVILRERRVSAKDMTLHEVLLANARRLGIGNVWHEIDVKLLMDSLKIDNPDRLFASLTRIAGTLIQYDVGGQIGVVSALTFKIDVEALKADLISRIKTNGGKVRYQIPVEVRTMWSARAAYSWLSLAAIASFTRVHTNFIYQMCAAQAGYSKLFADKPLKISARDLARQMNWSTDNRSPFNATLFRERVLVPSVEEINSLSFLTGFTVSLAPPTRSAKPAEPVTLRKDGRPRLKVKKTAVHGRPLDDLEFRVTKIEDEYAHTGISLKRLPKVQMDREIMDFVMMPDRRFGVEWLPSLRVFQAAVHQHFNGSLGRMFDDWMMPGHKRHRFPKDLSRAWRCAVDLALDEPFTQISKSYRALDIMRALEDRTVTIDKFFMLWVGDGPTTFKYERPDQAPEREVRVPPEVRLFSDNTYGYLIQMRDRIDGRKSAFDLTSWFANHGATWEHIASKAPDGMNLGGLNTAFQMMSTAHPDRQKLTARTLYTAMWAGDFGKIEKIMKGIFASKDKLKLHPVTGLPYQPSVKSKRSQLDNVNVNQLSML